MKSLICDYYTKCPSKSTCPHAKVHEENPQAIDDEDFCQDIQCPNASVPRGILCRKLKPNEELIIDY